MGSLLREKIEFTKVPDKTKDIETLEVDELFRAIAKKAYRHVASKVPDSNSTKLSRVFGFYKIRK
tara:strand:- start:231 stop:425 length:195 start_codon:yes stop_codon:yes gene_type:complete